MLGELYQYKQTGIQTYRRFLIIPLKMLQTIHICCYRNKRYWVVLAVEPFYFVSLTFTPGKNADSVYGASNLLAVLARATLLCLLRATLALLRARAAAAATHCGGGRGGIYGLVHRSIRLLGTK